jgi:hypothetical protein
LVPVPWCGDITCLQSTQNCVGRHIASDFVR